MANRQVTERKSKGSGKMGARISGIIIGVAACILAGFIGVGVANAFGTKVLEFGVNGQTTSATTTVAELATNSASVDDLTQPVSRDISASVANIDAQVTAAREAEEAALKAEEERVLATVQQRIEEQSTTVGIPSTLSGVDWTVGKYAFIETWTQRIDAFLAGSPLAGQGATFATAAWENCVDPRWSPAISMTESSAGRNCFKSHNAWGWGTQSWDSWEEAINAHVTGLSEGYGYTICKTYAKIYCPPNWANWYATTIEQMKLI